jgi:DHA2 family multidrug resistance protein
MVTSYWEDEITRNRAELVGVIDPARMTYTQLIDQGMTDAQAAAVLERMVTEQSVMLATNELMLVVALMLIFSAFVIWLVPKPTRTIDPSAAH